jgi:hypothetical protein
VRELEYLGDELEGDLCFGVPVLVRVQLQRCAQITHHIVKPLCLIYHQRTIMDQA